MKFRAEFESEIENGEFLFKIKALVGNRAF